MKQFKYMKADAFTSGNSTGNPAACIYLNDNESLTEQQMQEIAKQHGTFVCEVAYCKPLAPNEQADYGLRYYSREREVDFCGHATVACMYYLIKNDSKLLEQPILKIATYKNEILNVYNDIKDNNAVYISAPLPKYFENTPKLIDISKALSIPEDYINKQLTTEIIFAGLNTLIIPITSLENTLDINPNEAELKEFSLQNNIDNILIFTIETRDESCFIHTRVFAPKFGYLEDPATGSSNCSLGYYLLKNQMWNGTVISIEQGKNEGMFNLIKIKAITEEEETKVLFGGKATVKVDGLYFEQ